MPPNLVCIAALSPLAAALAMTRVTDRDSARWLAAASLAVSLAVSLAMADGIGRAPMVLFAAIALATVPALPRQDSSPKELALLLLMAGGVQTVYSAPDRWLLLAGYLAATLPFLSRRQPLASVLLATSCLALGGAAWTGSFWMLLAAIALSKGLFPLEISMTALFERRPLGTAALLFNAHLGAFLLIRFGGGSAGEWLPLVGKAALAAAVFTGLIALVETKPRRILSLVATSQAGCILAGLASGTPQGAQGALMQWIVVGLASTGMLTVYRLVEVRHGAAISGREFLGLAERFPRLAVFFAACALAMVGLPGTLGFLSEDLLIHGLLMAHSSVGVLQLMAAALNAATLLKLFATLFLGRRANGLGTVPDALPRERWPLTALVVLLVLGGLMPSYVAAWGSAAANAVTTPEARR